MRILILPICHYLVFLNYTGTFLDLAMRKPNSGTERRSQGGSPDLLLSFCSAVIIIAACRVL